MVTSQSIGTNSQSDKCGNRNAAAAPGRSSPLGATPTGNGVNFSVYSRDATGVDLLFFDREDDATPTRVITLDPFINRTYHYWHIFIPGTQAGQI